MKVPWLNGDAAFNGGFHLGAPESNGVWGGKKRKKGRKERIWSREKSPAARANTRDGPFEGGVLGDKIQSLFPKGGRSEGLREQGKEKKNRRGNFPNICVSKSQFLHQVLFPLLHTSPLLPLETSVVASTTTKPRKCH